MDILLMWKKNIKFQMYSQYSFMDYIGDKENLLPLQIITAQID